MIRTLYYHDQFKREDIWSFDVAVALALEGISDVIWFNLRWSSKLIWWRVVVKVKQPATNRLTSKKVENWFHNLLLFLLQAVLLLDYRPVALALQCRFCDTESGLLALLPPIPMPPPVCMPMDPYGWNRTLPFFTPDILNAMSLPLFPVFCLSHWFYLYIKALVKFNFFLESKITSLSVRSPKF